MRRSTCSIDTRAQQEDSQRVDGAFNCIFRSRVENFSILIEAERVRRLYGVNELKPVGVSVRLPPAGDGQ
jgi:hypothetical protein